MWVKLCVVVCAVRVVACEREGRLFSFNFLEDRDISVDLDFSIPFITIPIKKSVDSLGGSDLPTININPASLVLAGAVVLGTTIFVPFLMKSYSYNTDYRYSRILDSPEFTGEAVLTFASRMLSDARGVRGCALRAACWSGKRYEGSAGVVQFVANNKLLSSMINATSLEDAMLSGRNGRDCMSYKPCPIKEYQIPVIINNIATLTKPRL